MSIEGIVVREVWLSIDTHCVFLSFCLLFIVIPIMPSPTLTQLFMFPSRCLPPSSRLLSSNGMLHFVLCSYHQRNSRPFPAPFYPRSPESLEGDEANFLLLLSPRRYMMGPGRAKPPRRACSQAGCPEAPSTFGSTPIFGICPIWKARSS